MEQYMELQLQGTDGEEKLSVDNLGKVLKIDESSKKDPISGNDVYLTIDKNLQKAAYQILEQKRHLIKRGWIQVKSGFRFMTSIMR